MSVVEEEADAVAGHVGLAALDALAPSLASEEVGVGVVARHLEFRDVGFTLCRGGGVGCGCCCLGAGWGLCLGGLLLQQVLYFGYFGYFVDEDAAVGCLELGGACDEVLLDEVALDGAAVLEVHHVGDDGGLGGHLEFLHFEEFVHEDASVGCLELESCLCEFLFIDVALDDASVLEVGCVLGPGWGWRRGWRC